MKKIILSLIASSFIIAPFNAKENDLDLHSVGFSITDLYLKEHSLDQIKATVCSYEFDKQYPIMKKIIAREKEKGFFGYHGCSQRYRVFQDILRAVFEESLGYAIPNDFQFLRIPGDEMFNLKNGKNSFFKLFDRKIIPENTKKAIITEFFIKPFNNSFGSSIHITQLTNEEQKEIWEITLEFLETLDSLAMEDYYSYQFEIEKLVSLDPFFSNQKGENAYLESVRKKIKMIFDKLDAKDLENTVESLSPTTSMAKLHNIFMRVLKNSLTNVSSDAVKKHIIKNFEFREMLYSIYSLTYGDHGDLTTFFFPYNDHIPGQQSRIVCLNMPLFGNYYRMGECSLYGFLFGSSIAGGDDAVMELLEKYFEEIGLLKTLPKTLKEIAIKEIDKSKQSNGSILQFFDNSEEPYQGSNISAYVSHSFGIPLKHLNPSQLILNEHPIQSNNLDLQLRLIPCNHTTLNPYSFLRIVRYDSQEPKVSKKIIQLMRKKLKGGVVNIKKLNAYKDKMDLIWSHTN
jgi:hypothetical protein